MFQIKEQDNISEELNEGEISNLPNRVQVIIKMLYKLGSRMEEPSDKFNKKANIKRNQTELKHTAIT